jgi:hypothetical protein
MQEEIIHINIKIANKSFENMAEFIYLGATITTKNCFYEEYRNKLNVGNARCHSLQKFFAFVVLF